MYQPSVNIPPRSPVPIGAGLGWAAQRVAHPTVYLHPGHFFVSAEPYRVTTILGSCVAVCLWDPVLGVGGVNHFLLPHWVGNGQSSARFGNIAVQQLLARLLEIGSSKQNLQAKVFGGACVIEAFQNSHNQLGSGNVNVAFKLLGVEGIPVVTQDVGGRHGRKLIFHTRDGAAWVKRL